MTSSLTSCRAFQIPYYIGMVVPFVILYLFNWVIFFIIVVSLISRSLKKRSGGMHVTNKGSNTTSSSQFIRQQVVIIVTLSVLFGLGWGLGLFATDSIHSNKIVRDLVASVFVLATAFHGLLIFVMHCIRSKDVRQEWNSWFRKTIGKNMPDFTSGLFTGQKTYQPTRCSDATSSTAMPANSLTLQRAVQDSSHEPRLTQSPILQKLVEGLPQDYSNFSLSRDESWDAFKQFSHSPENLSASSLEGIRMDSFIMQNEAFATEDCETNLKSTEGYNTDNKNI